MPPPEPRSRHRFAGIELASAVGLPQPSEAFSAVSGISPAALSSYRFEVIGSQLPSVAEEPPQQPFVPPFATRRAASPYFSLTISFTSTGSYFLLIAC